MRLWVAENGLRDRTGHHLNNSLGLLRACAARGLEPRFLVHRRAEREVLDAVGGKPVFAFMPYESVSTDPLAGPLESMLVQGAGFADGLGAAGESIGADDLVVVPTATQAEVYGCAMFMNRLAPASRPRLILHFCLENFLFPRTMQLGVEASLYRFAVRELERVADFQRVLLTASGERMVETLGKVLGRPALLFPMPKHYPFEAAAARPRASAPCVSVLGHSLPKKGFALVPALVAGNPSVRWLVQVSPPGEERLWPAGLESVANAATHVETVTGSLEPQAYYGLLARTDIALLPYDATQLPLRTSGVFAEAVAAGKVVVAPRRTWMAEHIEAGRASGVLFEHWSVEDIGSAVAEAVARFEDLSPAAQRLAPAWRDTQCVAAYLDKALATLGVARATTGA